MSARGRPRGAVARPACGSPRSHTRSRLRSPWRTRPSTASWRDAASRRRPAISSVIREDEAHAVDRARARRAATSWLDARRSRPTLLDCYGLPTAAPGLASPTADEAIEAAARDRRAGRAQGASGRCTRPTRRRVRLDLAPGDVLDAADGDGRAICGHGKPRSRASSCRRWCDDAVEMLVGMCRRSDLRPGRSPCGAGGVTVELTQRRRRARRAAHRPRRRRDGARARRRSRCSTASAARPKKDVRALEDVILRVSSAGRRRTPRSSRWTATR